MKHLITRKTTNADIECVILGRLGFSYKLIGARTGLSNAQIALRLKQTSSQVKLYRNGVSALAVRIADLSHLEAKTLIANVRKQLTQ